MRKMKEMKEIRVVRKMIIKVKEVKNGDRWQK